MVGINAFFSTTKLSLEGYIAASATNISFTPCTLIMLSFMLKVDVLAIKERESCLGCIETNFDPNKDSS